MFSSVLLVTALFLSLSHADPICCTPTQWEAIMFWDNGNVFIDLKGKNAATPHLGTAFSYINGSIKYAYDYTNGRTFLQLSVTEISPLIPQPVQYNTTLLRDYKNGVQYQYGPGTCEKSKLDPLKQHCVPGDATHLGQGTLGRGKVNVTTFAYTLPDFPYNFQSTITENGCIPVHVVYIVPSINPDSGAVNSLEITDVTQGIHDPTIFTVPQQCLKVRMDGEGYSNQILPFL